MKNLFVLFATQFMLWVIIDLRSTCKELRIQPDLLKTSSINTKYVTHHKAWIQRFQRRGETYLNIHWDNIHQWGNNVTMSLFFYEYLHNEYRPSIVELSWKLCDAINKDNLAGAIIRRSWAKLPGCPFPPDHYEINNISLVLPLPSLFPIERGKMELNLSITKTKETIASGFIRAKFITVE